ncbi:head-tail connector protein [Lederbergia wuyishanensis]|uniref:N12 class adenine-specific DNA methylase n=1 Tax=Lederbergia wuyishanensis TaxID=1347903 RepID=A0ABU0D4G7_9BACI|nr:head-tail connector protein [Lederbergia wuyishanensis]MCJ8008115.1 head-tail connector protein [Lederbergia wuyishanensis]MDQ0343299.1 N12 class adenine-specific DNA methylase [Lederbergia wuyishanensis]
MKVSEVTIKELMEYAREYNTEDPEVIKTFTTILAACKTYIKGYTGLDDKAMDMKEDLTVALMVLSNELYDNRTFTVENDKVNIVIKSILDMHSINLL